MKAKKISQAIEEIAPLHLAQDWDNVGLLIGNAEKNVKNILLTIDVTKSVLAEARRNKVDMILGYHPVIWDGLRQITTQGPENLIYELIKSNIAVYSIHTALDAAAGGVNDALADIIGIENPEPIGDFVSAQPQAGYKLVVFIPAESVNIVADAIFEAGAGTMGNYSHCGFQATGEGSFLPHKGARPAIGKQGRIERVNEVRFETIVSAEKLGNVVEAMKNVHPYEEPAFDIFRTYPYQKIGLGKMGGLREPEGLGRIIGRIKKTTGAAAMGFVGRQNKTITKAAVCAGSCGKIINSVIAAGCDLYLTGELKHHQALAAKEADVTCICLSHSVSERFILKKLAKQLRRRLNNIKIQVSRKDSDPFEWKKI